MSEEGRRRYWMDCPEILSASEYKERGLWDQLPKKVQDFLLDREQWAEEHREEIEKFLNEVKASPGKEVSLSFT